MARIAEKTLEELKKLSLVALLSSSGCELKKVGNDLVTQCPFHDDDTASLVVTEEKNVFHCFGCGAAGSPIDWVMKNENVGFRRAVDLLLSRHPETNSSGRNADLDLKGDDLKLLRDVVKYYHETLKETPEAMAYLAKRGLQHPRLVQHFQLGFANRTLSYRLPSAQNQGGKEARERLQKLGIMRSSGHEHLTGSLVVPVLDKHQNIGEIYGRKINSHLRKGTPLHMYLPGPHRGVFNLGSLKSEVILCESIIDALTFWCAEFTSVTSSFGASGFTLEMMNAFADCNVKKVFIAYDRDEAGDRGATEVAKMLADEGIACFRVLFPKGKDANSYANSSSIPAVELLKIALHKAEPMGGCAASEAKALVGDEKNELPPLVAPIETAENKGNDPHLAEENEDAKAEKEFAYEAATGEARFIFGPRSYRVRGLLKNHSFDTLKVNLLAAQKEAFHVDTFDLYSSRHRAAFIQTAAKEIGSEHSTIKKDIGRLLLKLEELQEKQIKAANDPQETIVELSEKDHAEAMELLQDPRLLERILEDFEACGVVGEETNKLVAYLAATSRKLQKPLAVMIQSSSAAGKSSLMEAVLAFIPDEEKVAYSAMTGQSLFYMGDAELKHKVLAIAEEEGAEHASYALKLLQSEGCLKIASTGKDPNTGRHATHEYEVEGPVAILTTTTAIDIDEELLNRCLVLTVDEGEKQTAAIHALQRSRRTRIGREKHQRREKLMNLHQNAQRLLEKIEVVNPFAEDLTFPSHQTRTRRDHEKYLDMMSTLALLHQHQRRKNTFSVDGEEHVFVEVTLADIEKANSLAHEILGRSLDELPPQTRKLLEQIHNLVQARIKEDGLEQEDVLFSRRDLRDFTGAGDTQLKTHLRRLVELELLLVHHGDRGRSFFYELLWNGKVTKGESFVAGIVDIETLKNKYDAQRAGQNAQRSGGGRPLVGAQTGGGRGSENEVAAFSNAGLRRNNLDTPENAHSGPVNRAQHHVVVHPEAAAAKRAC